MLISAPIHKGAGVRSCPGKVDGNLKADASAELKKPNSALTDLPRRELSFQSLADTTLMPPLDLKEIGTVEVLLACREKQKCHR